MIKLGIDMYGGDYAPSEIILGVKEALKDKELFLYLVGDKPTLEKIFLNEKNVKIIHAGSFFSMGEKDVLKVMRDHDDNSLVILSKMLREKTLDGIVTAGPTQGLVVTSLFICGRMKGMKRLAILPEIPPIGGKRRFIVDAGANLEISASDMHKQALVVSEYLKLVYQIKNPKIGLINVGSEKGKGRALENEVYNLLENDSRITFFGNIEAKEILKSDVDVVLTDGFSGNLLMKSMEGAAKAVLTEVKTLFKGPLGALAYLFLRRKIKRLKKTFDSDNIGGALVLGANGVIVKSHGSSKAKTFLKAIFNAKRIVKSGFIKIAEERVNEN